MRKYQQARAIFGSILEARDDEVFKDGSAEWSVSTDDSRKSSVSFGSIEVREYVRIVGDHPDVSGGPPLAIGWEFVQDEAVPVDDFEESRRDRRHAESMVKTKFERIVILHREFGISIQELKKAGKEAKLIKKQRKLSNKTQSKFVERTESAFFAFSNKVKRALSLPQSSSQHMQFFHETKCATTADVPRTTKRIHAFKKIAPMASCSL